MIKLRQFTRQVLEEMNFKPSKKLGQNFLINNGIFKKIVTFSGLGPDHIVLEIGPGLGGLTQTCASVAHAVWAVEIDWRLFRYLKEHVSEDHVSYLRDDIVNMDVEALVNAFSNQYPHKKLVVMGNLPYSISTEILMRLMRIRKPEFEMVFMLQKEFVDRLKARPRSDGYGEIALLFESACIMDVGFKVNKRDFYPVPGVDSIVIRIRFKDNLPEMPDQPLLWQIIRAGFSQRRKMLKNALTNSDSFPYTVSNIEAALQRCHISDYIRAEELALQDFVHIVLALNELENPDIL
ncbi:MAG: 16S rRNA (adenine(1518)-N(6)/adenine(1519)-N(6))-dimethyltransferase RsmA [Chlamydiota bacterium]|nr:16S rRNA (adenine(1518)-N(6)/adenine(1519)-N(6))-dimethyltransferase RsmA [Chlamydiota bacterium]